MNDTALSPSSGQGPGARAGSVEPASEADQGLRSLPGIRWLLLAGALLTGVSAFRLAESRWSYLPVEAQFLLLSAGVLGLYGLGRVARDRLALRHAGSAAQGLFVVLVPVLTWGAASMDLLRRPLGFPALVVGLVPLLLCVRRVLEEVFHYRGLVYPAALAVLAIATPLLPRALGALDVPPRARDLVAALVLGAVLHAGARHVNRFLFHRDRRDGIDRPLSLVPFVFLALFYALAVGCLSPWSVWLAVPLAVMGLALVDTGEEYVRALEDAGLSPTPWPARSRALLSAGWSLLAISVLGSLFDGRGQAFAVVMLLAAARLVIWGRARASAPALSLGLLAAFFGYNASPVLFRAYAMKLVTLFYAVTGIREGSASAVGFGDLGFTALLVALGALLSRDARDGASEVRTRLVLVSSLALTLHGLLVAVLSMGELRGALLVLPPLALLLLAGVLVTRRAEALVALQAALSLLALRVVLTKDDPGLSLVAAALVSAAFVVVSLRLERRLVRFLDRPDAFEPEDVRLGRRAELHAYLSRLVGVPAAFLAVTCSFVALTFLESKAVTSGAALVACGALFLAAAVRLRARWLAVVGVVAISAGAHGALLFVPGLLASVGPAVTLLLLLAGYLVRRRFDATLALVSSNAAGLLHGPLAMLWLLSRLFAEVTSFPGLLVDSAHRLSRGLLPLSAFGPRALGLVVLGLWLLSIARRDGAGEGDEEERARRRHVRTLGLGLLLAFPAVQLFAVGLLPGLASLLLALGLTAGVALFLVRSGRADGFLRRTDLRGGEVGRADAPCCGGCGGRSAPADCPGGETERSLAWLLGAWSWLAVACTLLVTGPVALALAVLNVVLTLNLGADAGKAGKVPLRRPLGLLLIVFLQVPVCFLGAAVLQPALVEVLPAALPVMAVLALAWLALHDAWDGRLSIELSATASILTAALAGVFAFAIRRPDELSPLAHGSLVAVAALLALRHARLAYAHREPAQAWVLQGFLAAGILESIRCGFLHVGSGRSPWVLLLAGVLMYAAARLVARTDRREVFENALLTSAFTLPALGSALALARLLATAPAGDDVWLRIAPAFLSAGLFAVAASRDVRRVPASFLSCGLLAAALATLVHVIEAAGPELHVVAPGMALLLLSQLLKREAGADVSRRLFTAGAALLYLAPVLALRNELAWGWQAVLLLLALAFGSASFALRSASLLKVSTAAFLVDLLCFVLKVHRTEPTVLWAIGALLGLALMVGAAALEWRREGVLQRLRVFASEVQAWK